MPTSSFRHRLFIQLELKAAIKHINYIQRRTEASSFIGPTDYNQRPEWMYRLYKQQEVSQDFANFKD